MSLSLHMALALLALADLLLAALAGLLLLHGRAPAPSAPPAAPCSCYSGVLKLLEDEQGPWFVEYVLGQELARLLSHQARPRVADPSPVEPKTLDFFAPSCGWPEAAMGRKKLLPRRPGLGGLKGVRGRS